LQKNEDRTQDSPKEAGPQESKQHKCTDQTELGIEQNSFPPRGQQRPYHFGTVKGWYRYQVENSKKQIDANRVIHYIREKVKNGPWLEFKQENQSPD